MLAAAALESTGAEYIGIERGEHLGTDLATGHHRLYREESQNLLRSLFPELAWSLVNEEAAEWKKGKWVPIEDKKLSAGQRYYLGSPFFMPALGYRHLVANLITSVQSRFSLRKVLQKIEPTSQTLMFSDGSEESYDRVLWCQSLESLSKILPESRAQVHGSRKHHKETAEGGVVLDMDLRETLCEKRNTVLLTFRFKEDTVHALGNRNDFTEGEDVNFSWTLFLEEGLLENREELAKCVRTFKRELGKQFPLVKESLIREKIVYLPLISGFSSLEVESLALFDKIMYLGSELRLGTGESENLDLLMENCREILLPAHSRQAAASSEKPEGSIQSSANI